MAASLVFKNAFMALIILIISSTSSTHSILNVPLVLPGPNCIVNGCEGAKFAIVALGRNISDMAECKTPSGVDLAAMKHPPTTFVHDLASRLHCRNCAKTGRRPSATLLQLSWQPSHPRAEV